MTVFISSDAEEDLVNGYWFYERQSLGLGDYSRSCLISDLDSLAHYGGIHACKYGHHRALSKRFPFCIYTTTSMEASSPSWPSLMPGLIRYG